MGSLHLSQAIPAPHRDILTDDALSFVAALVEKFQPALEALLQQRIKTQAAYDQGVLPDFLPETLAIRNGDWKVRAIPQDLLDRRVEITGPTDRKMVINALNANVKVFMADFEDALSPTWFNVIDGQLNLRDANRGEISYDNPETGKHYALNKNPALLIARVRGLHLPEKHITFKDHAGKEKAIPGCLLDFALYFYHNHQIRLGKGSGVYYYLPKMQSYLEARWWSEVFKFTEQKFNVPVGSIRATVLIETLPAVFQMDEMLYELRDYIVGLNCGRWDYIFSYIKTLRNHPDRILPDRQSVTMDKPFLNAYSRLLIKTCHKRGAFAMGGMAAFIPQKDHEANEKVLVKVRADKQREADNGHDGTWVAHPGLADTAMEIFNAHLGSKQNQLNVMREQDSPITAKELLQPSEGLCTEEGMRLNIRITLQYIESWIHGHGCVPIYGLMEDAATAEISRTSIWQWIHHGIKLSNGKLVTKELFKQFLKEEAEHVKQELGADVYAKGKFERAAQIFIELNTSDTLTDFLTLPAYRELN